MTTSATSHIEEGQARTWKTRWRLSGVIKNRNYQARLESVILTTGFRHATSSRCKTDVLEIDLHETLDGVAVVCHDPNLQRLCGRDIEVSQINFCGKRIIIASIKNSHAHHSTGFIFLTQIFKKKLQLKKVFKTYCGPMLSML